MRVRITNIAIQICRGQEDVEGHINLNIGDLISLKLFTNEKNNSQEKYTIMKIAESLEQLEKKLENIEL